MIGKVHLFYVYKKILKNVQIYTYYDNSDQKLLSNPNYKINVNKPMRAKTLGWIMVWFTHEHELTGLKLQII